MRQCSSLTLEDPAHIKERKKVIGTDTHALFTYILYFLKYI